MNEWLVDLKPHAQNPGSRSKRNEGGLAIALRRADWDQGMESLEVTRVAYARQNSRNPAVAFEDQLQEEIVKAQEVCEKLNDFEDERDRLIAEARMAAREQIAEILGAPQKTPA